MSLDHSLSALKVLVVGGGSAGMAAAIVLKRNGARVELIDIKTDWGMIGAGITLTGPSLRALRDLSVFDEIAKRGYVGEGIRVCDTQGNFLRDLGTPMPESSGVPGSGGIQRPLLQSIIEERLRSAGVPVELGISVAELKQLGDGVDVTFTDGRKAAYDLVLGADGVGSRVRHLIIPDSPPPQYTGQNSWRVTVPRPAHIDRRHYFLGGPHMVGLSPVSKDEMYLFLLEVGPKTFREEKDLHVPMAKLLASYGGTIGTIRDNLTANSKIVFRPLEAFILPPPWYRGRVLLVGDAAHPTTPQLSSGAGMAIEDGLVLEDELKRNANVDKALESFMVRREPRCRMIVESSMEIGRLEQAQAPSEARTAIVERALAKLQEAI